MALFNLAAVSVADNIWSYHEIKQDIKKEKLGSKMSTEGFEKFQHFPGNLEAHMWLQGYAHAQERPEKVLISHLWLILYKQEVRLKWSSQLPGWALKVPLPPFRASWQMLWDLLIQII